MAHANPREVLTNARTVAVVGCSANPAKTAHRIPSVLQDHGFDIWPVNPNAAEILGRPAVPSLDELVEVPDLVVVFRPSEEAAAVTRSAAEIGASAVWLQSGIVSAEAEQIAADAGMDFVQDRCTGVDVRAFGIDKTADTTSSG